MIPFVPPDFDVPATLEAPPFRLRMLTVNDVVRDYDAVMSSIEHLRRQNVFGGSWPASDLTLEQNLIDLGWHQKEFQIRRSFTYTVSDLDDLRCLGCVYIVPAKDPETDANVYLWVRQSEYEKGNDPVLFDAVRKWIAERWPFETVAYPGR